MPAVPLPIMYSRTIMRCGEWSFSAARETMAATDCCGAATAPERQDRPGHSARRSQRTQRRCGGNVWEVADGGHRRALQRRIEERPRASELACGFVSRCDPWNGIQAASERLVRRSDRDHECEPDSCHRGRYSFWSRCRRDETTAGRDRARPLD